MNAPNDRAASLADIEAACKRLGDAREHLRGIVARMQAEVTETTTHYRRDLQAAIDRVANEHEGVLALVSAAPALFRKPRSAQWHGVKCGWQKGKGAVSWDDDERVCGLIERHLPDQAETLIRMTRKPVAAALANLDGRELRRLGVSLVDAGDAPFVKPVDSELDRTVKRLVEDATQPEAA